MEFTKETKELKLGEYINSKGLFVDKRVDGTKETIKILDNSRKEVAVLDQEIKDELERRGFKQKE